MRITKCLWQLFWLVLLVPTFVGAYAQQSQKLAEVRFTTDTQDERDAGVWIDGKYAGYVKELKGDRKVMLSAGEHEISIRQAGYKELTKKIVVDSDEAQTVAVALETDTKAIFPGNNAAELRLDIQPKRAAVYLDGGYMGHGSDFGGRFHSMLVAPGKHKLRVELDGYIPYENEINPVASEKSRMNIALLKSPGAAQGK
jgi:PEGA domain-containing protein